MRVRIQNLTYCLSRIQNPTLPIDYKAFGHLLQHCTDHSLLSLGRQLHARLTLLAISPRPYLASKLLSLYAKCNCLVEARLVFSLIPEPNLFAFNALLIALSLHDLHSETCETFSLLVSSNLRPDNFSLTCLLKSEPSVCREAHAYSLRLYLIDVDSFVPNSLVTAYANHGRICYARNVFDKMGERDVVSWNAMVSGYSQAGLYEECLGGYREMVNLSGCRPNGVTAMSVFQACGHLGDMISGMEMHKRLLQSGVELDNGVLNSLVGFYSKCGALDYAQKLFESMLHRDSISWGVMICGYFQHGRCLEAMGLFEKMKRTHSPFLNLSTWNAVISGLVQNAQFGRALQLVKEMQRDNDVFRPNSVTISSILPACSYFSSLIMGREIHCYSIRTNHDSNFYVVTALIDMYSKSGNLNGVLQVFRSTVKKSVVIWTSIMAAHASHGQALESLKLFSEMQSHGVKPDHVTITSALSACSHGGLVDKGQYIFSNMVRDYGIEPGLEHYGCMVDLLGRSGRLEEAAKMIESMKIKPGSRVWGSLLGASVAYRNVRLAEWSSERLFEIEPECVGNYVLLANVYAKVGRWEDSERVRGMIRERGLRKKPGCSWVEVNRALQSFVVGDRWKPRLKEVYGVLEDLAEQMSDEGYVGVALDELDGEYV